MMITANSHVFFLPNKIIAKLNFERKERPSTKEERKSKLTYLYLKTHELGDIKRSSK